MAKTPGDRKGSYGAGLPVAGAYVVPRRRRRIAVAALVAAAVVAAVFVFDGAVREGRLVSNGPLTSGHANLERDCAACHTPFGEVSAEQCSVCHEKHGDRLGVFSFAAHNLYRSDDFRRVVPSSDEIPCASCHPDHRGREALITEVPDARCVTCHDYGSFNTAHPAFAFTREPASEPAGLKFAHGEHVREVMARQGLIDVEKACLTCHHPQADGKAFEAIEFDRHCDACHLTTSVATSRLPIAEDAQGVGVLTLATIQDRGGPGAEWAFYTNPNEFRQVGARVTKTPLHHRDPWVLENLRRLRGLRYSDAGLADLLVASAEVPTHEVKALYEEAIATLRAQAQGLRSRPEPAVQEELARIDVALAGLERALEDPYVPLDETAFLLALSPTADGDSEQNGPIDSLIEDLTVSCRVCHTVENATIARVQTDQRTMRRADFDHRSHILQARCLDCHTTIPIEAAADATVGAVPEPTDAEVLDHAGVYFLPDIENCRACHTAELASNRCVTCHRFHPDQGRRSNLLLYLDDADG